MRGLSARQLVFTVAMIVLVFGLGWLSQLTRPSDAVTNSWWPAAGVAIGAGIRLPRRYAAWVSIAAGAVSIPVAVSVTGSTTVGIWIAIASVLETFVGIVILRGRNDRIPPLRAPRDIVPLLTATFVAAILFDVSAATLQAILSGDSGQQFGLSSAAPRHAAGILLVTPLFMAIPRRPHPPLAEMVLQVVVTMSAAAAVFVVSDGFSLAFVPYVPLVLVALRVPTRTLLIELIAVCSIAAFGSAHGSGPFSFSRLGAIDGSVMLQLFQASTLIVFLSLSLVVSREQDSRDRLGESEELFRSNFDASFSGMAIVTLQGQEWNVERYNAAAAVTLPAMGSGEQDLAVILGATNSAALTAATLDRDALTRSTTFELPDGRHLATSLVALGGSESSGTYAMQFLDVTDSIRARLLVQEELDRAGEIHRALTPMQLPPIAGWSCAAMSAPARQVGGDFYDLQLSGHQVALSLGDVMGKGVGAGMLAASARTALRAASTQGGPAHALTSSAAVLDGDLMRSEAFITLVSAVVDLRDGQVRIADAGHGLAFLMQADGRVARVCSEDMPLGFGSQWSEEHIVLGPGDALLLVSDGVMDLWGDTVSDLQDAIEQSAAFADGDVDILLHQLCAAAYETLDRDDVTAVVMGRDARVEADV